MKTILFIFLMEIMGFKREDSCIRADVILLADLSGSVIGRENTIHEALYTFVSKFEMEEDGLRIGAYTFNDDVTLLYSLGSNKNELIRGINTIRSTTADGSTHLFEALMATMGEFNTKGRPDVKRIVVVISDGAPNDPMPTLAAGQQLQRMYNATIYGILIKSTSTNEPFMQQLSSKGCYLEVNYETLVSEINKLNLCI